MLLRNTRTTDTPLAAKSAVFLFHLAPRRAACALLRDEQGQDLVEYTLLLAFVCLDRKSTRLNSSHIQKSRMPSSA